jgi:hypothetical protein
MNLKYTPFNIPKFPINPSIGATHNPSGKKEYIWNGEHWTISKNHNYLPSFSYDENEPTGDLKPGDVWIDESSNIINIWDGEDWYSINNSPVNDGVMSSVIRFTREVPVGSIDGFNFVYKLSKLAVPGSEHVYLNGLLQKPGDDFDYTIIGDTIYFILPPYEDSIISVTYLYESDEIVVCNRPSMIGFNELPDGFRRNFNAEVANGTEIVFLNGVMQLENEDYTVSVLGDIMTITYTEIPSINDRINIYGVTPGFSTKSCEAGPTGSTGPIGPTGPAPAFFYQENEPSTDQETGSFWYNSSNDLLSVLVDGGIWKPAKGTSGPVITNIQSDIFKEIPSGSIDGINFMYELTHTPLEGSDHVYLNGLLQREGDDYDYTISGNQIFFILPPYEDSLIACTYSYQGHIQIDNEIPIKLPSENQFELLYTPAIGRESVYLNGLLQRFGVDYVISGKIITFVNDLDSTDKIIVDYLI